ncbi:MAG: TlpA family protein disulfide reductase [Actinomycetota bacterium]
MDTAVPATHTSARRWLRVALVVVPSALIVGVLAWALLQEGSAPQPGDEAPRFTAARLDGEGTISLSDFEGRPVLLNFWASWCLPCEDEAPILNEAQGQYGDDIAFVGVNIKDARDDALEFENRYGTSYPSVRDERQEIYDDYGLTGQPETFLIDGDGIIVEHIPGSIADQAYLNSLLDALITRS